HARWAEEVAAVDSAPINRTFVTVAGVGDVDTYDSGVFPSRGIGLRAVSEWSGSFSHHVGDVRGYLPLGRRVSLWAGATLGASGGRPSSAPSGRSPSLPTCSPAYAGMPARCWTAGPSSPPAG